MTFTVERFKLTDATDSACELQLRLPSSSGASTCISIQGRLSAPPDLPNDEGAIVFDDFVNPDGRQIVQASFWSVRPGATADVELVVGGGQPGGTAYVEVGIINGESVDAQIVVPSL